MLGDLICIFVAGAIAAIFSYLYTNSDLSGSKTVFAFITIISYIATLVLGIKFVIHFFKAMSKIW